MPKKEIARRLHKHRSTVYRELARNTGPVGYIPEEAQQRTDVRRWVNQRIRKMSNPERAAVCLPATASVTGRRIRSPVDPAASFVANRERQISRQTIYDWIHQTARRRTPHVACLPAFWRPAAPASARRGPLAQRGPHRRSPRDRGFAAALRRLGRRHDRGTWPRGRSVLAGGTQERLHAAGPRGGSPRGDGPRRRRTAPRRVARHRCFAPTTFDNGKEFAEHERLSATTGLAIYFAQPYAAWQRGTNENTNGLVRQYVPKGTDLKATSHRAVAAIESSLNDRPRKRLGYRTPREVLNQYATAAVSRLIFETALMAPAFTGK